MERSQGVIVGSEVSLSSRAGSRLKQGLADELERVLGGPPADHVAISGKVQLFDSGLTAVGQADVDEADGLLLVGAGRTAAWPGETCDGDSERGSGALANTFGECTGDLGAYGTMGIDH